jgi:tetratricopeptide (TPR) repeat protein
VAGLSKNEYSRDALFNLSLTLQKLQQWDEADTYLRRLVTVDPENPEVYQIMALNYQGKAKIAKAAADKKPATDPAVKAYAMVNDSLLHYFNKYQNATTRVSFSLWAHDGEKHTLAGTVENMGEAEKPYTLKFEFLDAKGGVVTSKEAVVGAVGAKAAKPFRLEVSGAGVLAFRYAPIS